MNPETRELFRRAVLQVLDANRTRFGLGLPAIRLHVAQFGFPGASESDLADDLDYLARKCLIEEVARPISAENRAWRITAAGMGFVDAGA